MLAEARMKQRAEEEAKRAMEAKREIEKNKNNVQNRRDLLGEKEMKRKIREVSKVTYFKNRINCVLHIYLAALDSYSKSSIGVILITNVIHPDSLCLRHC
jgi:hypothetical protein